MASSARPIDVVYKKAMELSDADRLRLADMLYFSASEPEANDWATSSDAELDEIEAGIADGRMKTYSFEEVRHRIRDRFDGTRDSLL